MSKLLTLSHGDFDETNARDGDFREAMLVSTEPYQADLREAGFDDVRLARAAQAAVDAVQ